ncbi:MAG: hypothetical protein WCH00_01010 [Candidatus Saccharibacteria bacterium]
MLFIEDFVNLHINNSTDKEELEKLLIEFIRHEAKISKIDTANLNGKALSKIHEPISSTISKLRDEYGFSPDELYEITEHLEDFESFINN